MKGLTAEIYRDNYTCPINAIGDKARVTVIDHELPGIFEPSEEAPAVRLVRRKLFGVIYIHAEPMEPGQYSAGGAFIYTSDSRLRAINQYPIPLHDRDMSKE